MKQETIKVLKDLRLGEKYPLYKPLSDDEKELQNTLSKLKNIQALKLIKNLYSVNNSALLSKFIELKDFEKLVELNESDNKVEKKSIFNKIYSDPWVIGIVLLIIASILSADRIKKWIDSIIDVL